MRTNFAIDNAMRCVNNMLFAYVPRYYAQSPLTSVVRIIGNCLLSLLLKLVLLGVIFYSSCQIWATFHTRKQPLNMGSSLEVLYANMYICLAILNLGRMMMTKKTLSLASARQPWNLSLLTVESSSHFATFVRENCPMHCVCDTVSINDSHLVSHQISKLSLIVVLQMILVIFKWYALISHS